MKKRCFITFLGTTDYKPTIYYHNNYRDEKPERYIQISTIKLHKIQDWTENDKIIILLTDLSEERNWLGENNLEKQLKQLNLKAEVKPIKTKNGTNEKELWEIYYDIFTNIEENSELYVDITHSFRSLPLLFTVVLHQLKNLKNVNVKSITYGNFEAGRKPNPNIKTNNNNQPTDQNADQNYAEAPIVDLTLFSSIMDIIDYSYQIKKFGFNLSQEETIKKIFSELGKIYQGKNRQLNTLRNINNNLIELSKILYYCDGNSLIEGNQLLKLKKSFDELRSFISPHSALNDNDYENIDDPILKILTYITNNLMDDINQYFKITDRSENQIMNTPLNMIYAADYCAHHHLYQQGFTLLQEGLKKIFEKIYLHNNLPNLTDEKDKSEFIGSFLNYGNENPENWKGKLAENKDIANDLLSKVSPDWFKIYKGITNLRNSINHAHIGKSALSEYNKKLSDFIESVNTLPEIET